MSSSNAQYESPLARHRQLAPTASVRVSPLCLGTMTFGNSHQEKYGQITKDDAFSILDHFYENGGNFLDTANGYKDGESEMWLGEWMNQQGNRDELVLATKFSGSYKAADEVKIRSNLGGNSLKSMRLSIEASLERLQTNYIDLFYVHFWTQTTSIPELMHALNDLVTNGKVLYLGISDTPAWIVTKANQYARDHGLRPFSVYQGMWNAAMRDFERDIIPMTQDEGMALCPYGVLNQGNFQTQSGYKEREKNNPGRNFIPTSEKDKQVAKVLEDLADSRSDNVTLYHIALAYVLQKTTYVFPIVGGRKVEHIMGNIEGLKVSLSEEEINKIEDAYNFDHGFPHTFLSGTLFDPSAKPKQSTGPGENVMNGSCGDIDWVAGPVPIRPKKN